LGIRWSQMVFAGILLHSYRLMTKNLAPGALGRKK